MIALEGSRTSRSPQWQDLVATVLAPGGSAPGVDGELYAVYQCGARFVSCLLGQAMHAAQHQPEDSEAVLGPFH